MKTDLSAFKKNNKEILTKLSEKKKLGRNPKEPNERLVEKVTLNFTKREKEKLLSISEEKGGLPLTILIRSLLKKNNWI